MRLKQINIRIVRFVEIRVFAQKLTSPSNSGLFDKIGRFSFSNSWTNVCMSFVKTSPSWQLFADVSLEFDSVEFVDIDDLGM